MTRHVRVDRYKVGALVGATTMLVGGSAALAGNGKGQERCEARLAKIAEKKGVSVDALKAGMQSKLLARIEAAVQAGKISPERAAALKQRVAEGNLCRVGHVRKHMAARGMMRAAAEFLGLSKEQLKAQLPGTSLAALAQKQSKSVDALKAAMVAPAKERLAKAVANGKIAQAKADAALAKLEQQATKLAEKVFPTK